jgi:la-related protein 1
MFLSITPRNPFEGHSILLESPKISPTPLNYLKRPSRAKQSKRSKFQEPRIITSTSSTLLKDPLRSLKQNEFISFSKTLQFFQENFSTISKDQIFSFFLELADAAKRENNLKAARQVLQISVKIQPTAHQTWLEFSKLEEECGKIDSAFEVLAVGIQFSPTSEQIFAKLVKVEEKTGSFVVCRRVLAGLRRKSLEKNWKVILEGALMEARNGNVKLARHLINSMIQQCSHFGGLYLEAVRFEEKWGKNLKLALKICEKGNFYLPRYAPLWFAALRINEKLLRLTGDVIFQAKQEKILLECEKFISKELLWKIFLDFSVYLYERNDLLSARIILKRSILAAPDHLRWKAWIMASRVEVKSENFEKALNILENCLLEVPTKQKPQVLIEKAQVFELFGDFSAAEETMKEAWVRSGKDWKVCLEQISMKLRLARYSEIRSVLKEALALNPFTGRLWASLVQVLHLERTDLEMKAFILAVREVPKSGEVWCEGARICLDPRSRFFNVDRALEYLNYAVQFTPQYGDSFIEMLRVFVVRGDLHLVKKLKMTCVNADPNYGTLWFFCKQHPLDGPREVFSRAKKMIFDEVCRYRQVYRLATVGQTVSSQFSQWLGLTEAIFFYFRYHFLDLNLKMKLVYGCEGVLF